MNSVAGNVGITVPGGEEDVEPEMRVMDLVLREQELGGGIKVMQEMLQSTILTIPWLVVLIF